MQNALRRPHSAAAVRRADAGSKRLNPVELLMLGLTGMLVVDLSLLGWGLTHGWPN